MNEIFALKVWIAPKEQFGDVSIFSVTAYQFFQQVERTVDFLDTLNQNLQEKIATYELYIVHPSSLFTPFNNDHLTSDIAVCIEKGDKPYNHFINHVSATVCVADRPRLIELLTRCGIKNVNLLIPLVRKIAEKEEGTSK